MKGRHVGLRVVLRRSGFRRLVAAHGLGTVGQLVLTLAVGAHVAEHGSALAGSVAVALGFAPYALFSPLAGVLADRASRSSVLGWSALVRSVLTAAVGVALLRDLPDPVAVTLAALAAVAGTPSYPALAAATPETVADDELEPANALVTCVENGGWMAGPGLFGLLLAAGLDGAALSFVAAVPLLVAGSLALPVRLPRPPRAPTTILRAELTAGVATVARRPDARSPMLLAMLDNAVYGYVVAVLVALAADGHRGAGMLQTAMTLGAVLAALAVGPLHRRLGTSVLLVRSLVVAGLAVACLGTLGPGAPLATLLPCATLCGAAGLVGEVAAVTLLQRSPDPAAVARVFGVYDQLNVGAIAVGSALAGALGHVVGVRLSLLLGGLTVVALASACTRVRPVNRGRTAPGVDLGWRPCPPTPAISSSSPRSTSREAAPSSSSKVLPAQRRPSATPSRLR